MNYPNSTDKWALYTVYGFDFRSELLDMAKTISKLNLWGWMRDINPPKEKGYMFWGDDNILAISNGLEKNGHSGATFACCLRNMQFIAKNGYNAWATQFGQQKMASDEADEDEPG